MSDDHFDDDDCSLPDGEGPSNDQPKSYEVGYGKPPKDTRFKPGQSGNRKGRPKSLRRTNMITEHLFNRKLTITEKGRTVEINYLEAMMRSLMMKVAKGDTRAIKLMFEVQPLIEILRADDNNARFDQETLAELTDEQLEQLEMILKEGTEKALAKRQAKN